MRSLIPFVLLLPTYILASPIDKRARVSHHRADHKPWVQQSSMACVIKGVHHPDPRNSLELVARGEMQIPAQLSERAFFDHLITCIYTQEVAPMHKLYTRETCPPPDSDEVGPESSSPRNRVNPTPQESGPVLKQANASPQKTDGRNGLASRPKSAGEQGPQKSPQLTSGGSNRLAQPLLQDEDGRKGKDSVQPRPQNEDGNNDLGRSSTTSPSLLSVDVSNSRSPFVHGSALGVDITSSEGRPTSLRPAAAASAARLPESDGNGVPLSLNQPTRPPAIGTPDNDKGFAEALDNAGSAAAPGRAFRILDGRPGSIITDSSSPIGVTPSEIPNGPAFEAPGAFPKLLPADAVPPGNLDLTHLSVQNGAVYSGLTAPSSSGPGPSRDDTLPAVDSPKLEASCEDKPITSTVDGEGQGSAGSVGVCLDV